MKALVLLLVTFPVLAAELDYSKPWCAANGGRAEVVLSDRSRADCITETHAIEADFAPKWAEAIGQSLHYARMTGKRAGILLIVSSTDTHLLERLKATITGACLQIDVWTITNTK